MRKRVIVNHFTMKIILRTCTLTVIRKFYLLKNILAYCGYSATSSSLLLLFEHKHFLNSNSENARSRMVASFRGSLGTGTKEDESIYWARFRCWISPRYCPFSLGASFETYKPFISLISHFFSGRVKPRIRASACIY